VPHKEPVLGEPVDQGNGDCCKEKLEVCGIPKEKPRGAATALCKFLREEEKLFKVNTGIRKKMITCLRSNSGCRGKISLHQRVMSYEVPELPRAVVEAENTSVSFSLELLIRGGHCRAGAGTLLQCSL